MCGFAGFLSFAQRLPSDAYETVAKAMADTFIERGPDDGQAWADADAGIALGFRRLAIIDLTPAGRQPMISADGRLVIAYNGEVYNTDEIRPELEAGGIHFRGHSDTEVILEGCAAWGVEETLRRLVGMFAFAVWDRQRRCLTLARDRVGIKPLYFGKVAGTCFFGSQLKAFSAHPYWKPVVDRDSLATYLRFGYVPAPRSIFEGVSKLLPGHLAEVTSNGTVATRAYWDLASVVEQGDRSPFTGTAEQARDALDTLLRDSVRRRMLADVPVGAFLSGGVDSSTVVALMQAQSSRPVRTFSIGFHETGFDEAPHARNVAEHLGTEHHELYVEPRHALDVIPGIPEWCDEPFSDSSQIPTYLVSELTRGQVTVSLSGDGGDELFAGYPRYFYARQLLGAMDWLPVFAHRLGCRAIRALSPSTWEMLSRVVPGRFRPSSVGTRMYKLASLLDAGGQEMFYRGLVSQWQQPEELMQSGRESVMAPWLGSMDKQLPNFIQRMQYLDLLSYLPDDILTKVDRASMAVSLEARVPLLDHRVVEFSWSLPHALKVRDGQDKWLLRQVLYRYVPRALIERPKMGFGVPIDVWLRGPLRDWAEELLGEKRLRDEGYFRPELIRQRWQEHVSGKANWQYPLWVILMFQAWKSRWLTG